MTNTPADASYEKMSLPQRFPNRVHQPDFAFEASIALSFAFAYALAKGDVGPNDLEDAPRRAIMRLFLLVIAGTAIADGLWVSTGRPSTTADVWIVGTAVAIQFVAVAVRIIGPTLTALDRSMEPTARRVGLAPRYVVRAVAMRVGFLLCLSGIFTHLKAPPSALGVSLFVLGFGLMLFVCLLPGGISEVDREEPPAERAKRKVSAARGWAYATGGGLVMFVGGRDLTRLDLSPDPSQTLDLASLVDSLSFTLMFGGVLLAGVGALTNLARTWFKAPGQYPRFVEFMIYAGLGLPLMLFAIADGGGWKLIVLGGVVTAGASCQVVLAMWEQVRRRPVAKAR